MAGERQCQFILGNTRAIVADTNELTAPLLQLDLYPVSTGIQAVFQQFLEYRGGALDDFAGGNLADQQVGKKVDRGRGGRVF